MAAAASLAAIGVDDVVGWGPPALREAWTLAGRTLGSVPQIGVDQLDTGAVRLLDVRARTEWDNGHIPGAEHAFLGDLLERVKGVPHDAPIVTQCQGGSRSAIAASLLRANGFTNVQNLTGGFAAWRDSGEPVDKRP